MVHLCEPSLEAPATVTLHVLPIFFLLLEGLYFTVILRLFLPLLVVAFFSNRPFLSTKLSIKMLWYSGFCMASSLCIAMRTSYNMKKGFSRPYHKHKNAEKQFCIFISWKSYQSKMIRDKCLSLHGSLTFEWNYLNNKCINGILI